MAIFYKTINKMHTTYMSYRERRFEMLIDSSKELALFLEKMRFLRGISQEDFTEGIISNRQYQRYVRGESPMPYHLLDLFAERLNLKKEIMLLEFENYAVKESQTIVDYHNSVMSYDFDKAAQIRKSINYEFIIYSENKQLYLYTKYMEDFATRKISVDRLKTLLFEMIDYPKMLTHSGYSMIEI